MRDLLLDDGALDVVGPEREANLGERRGDHDPVRLDVLDVVEHQARDGDHLEVVLAGRELPATALEDGVLRVERQRDEGHEAPGLVLQFAQRQQVLDALLVRLDVVVQHRAVRLETKVVRDPMGLEPLCTRLLARRDDLAHTRREDLGTATRQGVETGVDQCPQHLLMLEVGGARHVMDLGGGKELEIYTRQTLLERRRDVDVVLEIEVRILATNHVDLGVVLRRTHLLRVRDEVVDVPHDRVGLLRRARKGAELALDSTDRRVVEVQVVDEEDLVGATALAAGKVGEGTEFEHIV